MIRVELTEDQCLFLALAAEVAEEKSGEVLLRVREAWWSDSEGGKIPPEIRPRVIERDLREGSKKLLEAIGWYP